jgi:hypothetical protein
VLLGTGFYSEPWLRITDRAFGALAALYQDSSDAPGH